MKARGYHLVGRTIKAVNFRPFKDGRGGTAHDPVLMLDNGKLVRFITEETDIGCYGTLIAITEPPAATDKPLATVAKSRLV